MIISEYCWPNKCFSSTVKANAQNHEFILDQSVWPVLSIYSFPPICPKMFSKVLHWLPVTLRFLFHILVHVLCCFTSSYMFILSLDKLVIETSVKPTVTGFLPFKGLYSMNTFYFFFFINRKKFKSNRNQTKGICFSLIYSWFKEKYRFFQRHYNTVSNNIYVHSRSPVF